MTTLSLRLPDELLHEVDVFADEMHIPRAAYVRKALEQMNASVAAQRRRTRLMEATQGGNYANFCKARFFVTHNHRQTKYWKVDHSKLAPNYAEIKDIPHSGASEKVINEILASLRTFREDEFADLLHQCHNVIRNREHLDPAAAFDEIAKILFVKVWSERRMRERGERKNLFTVDVLNQQLSKDPINSLFDQTKESYKTDKIFDSGERINLRPATVEEIVKRLQAYNLSDTSEDVKGIAFERFLGRTFRGEIGQFFTPRSIVEFMIRMVEPKENDVICDPASGSGGFLIRAFELIREQIAADEAALRRAERGESPSFWPPR